MLQSWRSEAAAIGAAAKPRSDWREKITHILVALRLRRSREVQRAVDLLAEAVSVKMSVTASLSDFEGNRSLRGRITP